MARVLDLSRRRAPRLESWLLALPFVVGLLVYRAPAGLRLELLVGAVAAAVVIGLSIRRPVESVIVIVSVLPLSVMILAFLYTHGAGKQTVKALAYWNVLLGLGVVAAGVHRWSRDRHAADWIDRVALGYIAVALAYVVVPRLFVSHAVQTTLYVRLLGFRQDVFYVALFLGIRHLRLGDRDIQRITRAFLRTAFVVGAVGWLEFFASSVWNHFAVDVVGVQRYRFEVLNVNFAVFDPKSVLSNGTVSGRSFVRIGATDFNPLTIAFYLALAFIIAIQYFTRTSGLRAPRAALTVAAIGGALLFTQTRAGVIAAAIATLFVLRRDRWRPERAQARLLLMIAAALVAIVPFLASAKLLSRFTSDTTSRQEHAQATHNGFRLLIERPLGRGIATSAGVGQHFEESPSISESQYLQIGTQMGIVAMVLWALALGGAGRALWRARTRIEEASSVLVVSAMGEAVAAFAVASFIHQTLIGRGVAWSFAALLGAGLGAVDRHPAPRGRERVPRSLAVS